jgi:spermidine synthase
MTVSMAYAPALSSILEIGFGGGRTTKYLHEYLKKTQIKSVELDPVVVEMAKKHFGIRNDKNFTVEVGDGRRYLMRSKKKWDLIMIDAYRGPFVPFHLLTREFFKTVKSRLTDKGIVVQNIEPSTMLFDAALATISTVFDHIDLYAAKGNVVAIAYNGPRLSQNELMKRAASLQSKYQFKYALTDMLNKRRVLTGTGKAKMLTDDFAPVEALLAIEKHNRKMDNLSVRVNK